MQNTRPHIIRRQSVHLHFYEQKEDFFLQEKIAALLKEKLGPALETLFDEKATRNKHIKIGTLDIDLGNVNAKNWEEEFVRNAIRKVRSKLDEIASLVSTDEDYEVTYINNEPRVDRLKSGTNDLAALKYFIKHGLLPWNLQSADIHELLQSVLKKAEEQSSLPALKKILIDAILFSPSSLERFLLQFKAAEIEKFFEIVFHHKYYPVENLLSELNIPGIGKKLFAILLFFVLMNDEEVIASVKNIFEQISFTEKEKEEIIIQLPVIMQQVLSENIKIINAGEVEIAIKEVFSEKENSIKSLPEEKKKKNEVEEEHFYFIKNAGLVILHPFLQPLFESLDLLVEKRFVDIESQRKAILLSQFLIEGETEISEHTLLLNKIICGCDLDKPVEAILELTEDEQKQSLDLLKSVIEYWTALKTTSIAGLRTSFLQREGKLTEFEDYWLLQVEQKSYDVLMNFLPWGIGIIKLPWMEKRLMVEWNS